MNRLKFLLLALAMCVVTGGVARAQALQRITVYVQNPTSSVVNFSYKMGGDDWKQYQLKAGNTMTFTGIATHHVRFQNGRGRVTGYMLKAGTTNYFQWSNGTLDLKHR